MCLNPKLISKRGKYKENNYRGMKGDNYSISVFTDCGCCSQCIAKKANNWVVRNVYESKMHDKKCFITLTYQANQIFLVRKDFQDWVKRFRFEINKEYYDKLRLHKQELNKKYKSKYPNLNKKIRKKLINIKSEDWKNEHEKEFIKTKIFYAGEYGTIRGRPHFHAIIYGWEDKNAYYTGISKKINIIYESEIIRKTWGLGRTSYQEFGEKETSYIALYNTAQQEFKKAYKLTREKVKQIKKHIEDHLKLYPKNQSKNLIKQLEDYDAELLNEKKKYLLIKEFNGWSLAMGWDKFYDEYSKSENYAFTEYILDMQFSTPSPWLKKLANKYGDIPAIKELLKREEQMIASKNEIEEQGKNELREKFKRKKEIIEWNEKGRKNGEIEEL